MPNIGGLLKFYERYISLPWRLGLSGPEKTLFLLYGPESERRLRVRLDEFEIATKAAGHPWCSIDLTRSFAEWMAAQEYRDTYFESPDDVEMALEDYGRHVIGLVKERLTAPDAGETSVVAVYGVASLFGLMRVSGLLQAIEPYVRGRLALFFPGERNGTNYGLLGVHHGWNYHATAIYDEEKEPA